LVIISSLMWHTPTKVLVLTHVCTRDSWYEGVYLQNESGNLWKMKTESSSRPLPIRPSISKHWNMYSQKVLTPVVRREMVTNIRRFGHTETKAWVLYGGVSWSLYRICFIRPGKPMENAFVESFQGKFRDGYLNLHWFRTIQDAREKIEKWRTEYNTERPHSSLNDLTPAELTERMVLRA
jgi:hypothetical protein